MFTKKKPAAGQRGIFALGAPGVLKKLLEESDFMDIKEQGCSISLQMTSVKKYHK
ncbi:MAG TPA: hypothetical protein VFX43_05660 [Chitinophagaceae bacterium]|nr:hypothetical protein [Chitinophagaceae bacterium]